MSVLRRLAVLVLAVFSGLTVQAQTLETRIFRVSFPAGSIGTTIKDKIAGREMVLYRIAAGKGQTMQVDLASGNAGASFNVYEPGRGPGDAALAQGGSIGPMVPTLNRFQGLLPRNGDYTVSVFLVPASARRGETASFTLRLTVTNGAVQLPGAESGAKPVPEPEVLMVSGVANGDRLNVRGGPSTANGVLFTLGNGEVVRNLGCVTAAVGGKWCNIHPIGNWSRAGWASARYLVATKDPGTATQLPDAIPVPGPGASGRLTCILSLIPLDCRFNVTRRGRGDATLAIARPLSPDRVIEFKGGRPVSANSTAGVFGEWQGDTVIVTIGTKERYLVPNAVLFGG